MLRVTPMDVELGDDEPVTMDDFYVDECGEDFGMSAEFPIFF
jgi:hypothetical protein